MDRLGKVIAVDVGDKFAAQSAVAVKFEGLVGHDRTEVRPAYADVDHIADLFSGVAQPLTRTDAVGKRCHFVQNLMDRGDDVLAIDHDFLAARRAQGGVQDGAVFRDVDLVAAKHGIDPLAQTALSGQADEQFECLLRDSVLRVVEEDSAGLGRQFVPALRVGGKKFPQVQSGHLRMMRFKGFPGGAVGQRFGAHTRSGDETKNPTLVESLNTTPTPGGLSTGGRRT